METKILEIRDRLIFIPALAIRLEFESEESKYLLCRAGFVKKSNNIGLIILNRDYCRFDPNDWEGRTLPTAHKFIRDCWDQIKNGSVIDVEFILGETITKKISERFTC